MPKINNSIYKKQLIESLKRIIGGNKKIEYREGRFVETLSADDLFAIAEETRQSLAGYGVPEEKTVEATIKLMEAHLLWIN